MFPPNGPGGRVRNSPSCAGADAHDPAERPQRHPGRRERRGPVLFQRPEETGAACGKRSSSNPSPGKMLDQPQPPCATSSTSICNTSPGRASSTKHRAGQRVDALAVDLHEIGHGRLRGHLPVAGIPAAEMHRVPRADRQRGRQGGVSSGGGRPPRPGCVFGHAGSLDGNAKCQKSRGGGKVVPARCCRQNSSGAQTVNPFGWNDLSERVTILKTYERHH